MVEVMVKVKTFLNDCSEKVKQHQKILLWITFAVVIALILIALSLIFDFVMTYPEQQVSQYGINNVTEKVDLVNQYRTTLIQLLATFAQILGGGAVAIGIYFAWGNLTTARDGQITERFTRAVDQLGNRKMEIRLGGIYALERIANESEKDYWSIMEILTAYVRNNSGIDIYSKKISLKNVPISMDIQANESTKNEVPKITILLDIQAIFTVIKRRRYSYGHGEANELNFEETNLKQAILSGANLTGANLTEANLTGTSLYGTNLTGAFLGGANLTGASLGGANLTEAKLTGANLRKANLMRANLSGANLTGANLTRTYLSDARLSWAYFLEANLTGANLSGANLTGAILYRTNLTGAFLYGANLTGAIFHGANLDMTNLEGANLKGAKDLTINQLSKVKTLYKAELDDELLIPLKEKYPALFEEPKL